MFIKFTSDNTGNAGGWLASYSATKAIFCSGITTLTTQSGSLTDGSGSFNYHENSVCKYRIMPDSAQSISLSFNEFNTFDENDFIMIFNMDNNQLLAKLYGQQNPGSLTFNTGNLLLMFHTNISDNAPGWSLDYYSTRYTGVTDPTMGTMLEIFPNPASELLLVNYTNSTNFVSSIVLSNMEGQVLIKSQQEKNSGHFQQKVDISGLSNGIYILHLITDKGNVNQKVIVRH
jgi:hypothetical protein